MTREHRAADEPPAVGVLGGYRVRHGLGERITAWVATEIAAHDLQPVKLRAPGDVLAHPGMRVAFAVLPTSTAMSTQQRELLAGLCPGLAVAPIYYGRTRHPGTAPLAEALVRHGVQLREPGVSIDAGTWHERDEPPEFDRITLHLLLDMLTPDTAPITGRWRQR